MELRYEHGLYIAACAYTELLGETPAREVAKQAGFRWNPQAKEWQTTDPYRARALRKYADVPCAIHLEKLIAEQERTKVLSRAAAIEAEIPCPEGLAYLPFQKVGVSFAAERDAVLIGEEMGLGKTVETLGMLNVRRDVQTVLTICPNTLKLNWRNEAQKWLLPDLQYEIAVVTSKWGEKDLRGFYDLARQKHHRAMAIMNYEIVHRFCDKIEFASAGKRNTHTLRFLGGIVLDQIVVDECHRIKGDTRQSKAVMGVTAARKALLSGSPIPNRVKELWNILHYLDPIRWNSFYQFAIRYCDAYQGPFGFNADGASHVEELSDVLRSQWMIRRLKKDVMQELPPKRRQVIELSANGDAKLIAAEWHAAKALEKGAAGLFALAVAVQMAKAANDEADYRQAVHNLREGRTAALREMSQVREATALAKLPQVIEHIHECLEEQVKVVVYFWHHSVAKRLQEEFADLTPAVITGATSVAKRQTEVERFQTDPGCRLFLGSIAAAGEGITLTAASLMILAELDWVPKNLKQVEDRLHRITQTMPVLIRYLVFEGSLDATMLRTIIKKLEVIDAVLDTEHHFEVEEFDLLAALFPSPATEPEREPATTWTTYQDVERDAIQMDPAEVARVHRSLQYLAGVCDFAHAKDGQGFNMVDARIGHQLAMQDTLTARQAVLGQKILVKYHKQLAGLAL